MDALLRAGGSVLLRGAAVSERCRALFLVAADADLLALGPHRGVVERVLVGVEREARFHLIDPLLELGSEGPLVEMASSAAAAPAIARSATSVTIALTFGLTRSIWARCAAMTSRADTSLRASRAASSTAVISQSSDGAGGTVCADVSVMANGFRAAWAAPAAAVALKYRRLTRSFIRRRILSQMRHS
jgi:hypothetical protein